jgi:hypothetical protein
MTLILPNNTKGTKGVILNIYNKILDMKKRYYVYAHYKLNGELFYIGKGTGGRNETLTARSEEWLNEAKDGFNTVIIADNLNNKQAFLIEQSVIRAMNPIGLTNKKIPSDVVEPYWKKTNTQSYVHTTTSADKAIPAIKKQINNIHFTDEEKELMSLKRKDCSENEKLIRNKAIVKRYKLKELNERLNRAKMVLESRSRLYA